MPDQIMTAIAVALASKTAETVFGGAKDAFTTLARLVRERFSHDENARKALDSAKNAPHDPAAVAALVEALDRLASADPEFAIQIRHLWHQFALEGNVMNSIGSSKGPAVQARDIHGDIHFGKS
jgi:hypothetical protein